MISRKDIEKLIPYWAMLCTDYYNHTENQTNTEARNTRSEQTAVGDGLDYFGRVGSDLTSRAAGVVSGVEIPEFVTNNTVVETVRGAVSSVFTPGNTLLPLSETMSLFYRIKSSDHSTWDDLEKLNNCMQELSSKTSQVSGAKQTRFLYYPEVREQHKALEETIAKHSGEHATIVFINEFRSNITNCAGDDYFKQSGVSTTNLANKKLLLADLGHILNIIDSSEGLLLEYKLPFLCFVYLTTRLHLTELFIEAEKIERDNSIGEALGNFSIYSPLESAGNFLTNVSNIHRNADPGEYKNILENFLELLLYNNHQEILSYNGESGIVLAVRKELNGRETSELQVASVPLGHSNIDKFKTFSRDFYSKEFTTTTEDGDTTVRVTRQQLELGLYSIPEQPEYAPDEKGNGEYVGQQEGPTAATDYSDGGLLNNNEREPYSQDEGEFVSPTNPNDLHSQYGQPNDQLPVSAPYGDSSWSQQPQPSTPEDTGASSGFSAGGFASGGFSTAGGFASSSSTTTSSAWPKQTGGSSFGGGFGTRGFQPSSTQPSIWSSSSTTFGSSSPLPPAGIGGYPPVSDDNNSFSRFGSGNKGPN